MAPTVDIRVPAPIRCCSLSSSVVAMLIPTTVDIAIAAPETLIAGSRNWPPSGFGRPCRLVDLWPLVDRWPLVGCGPPSAWSSVRTPSTEVPFR